MIIFILIVKSRQIVIVSNAEWKQVRAFWKLKMQHFVVLSHFSNKCLQIFCVEILCARIILKDNCKISSNRCRMEASQDFPEAENATFCRFVPSLYYIQMFPIPMILCNCTPHGTAQRCILTKFCLLTI